jgi:acyl-CoA thioesterase-1
MRPVPVLAAALLLMFASPVRADEPLPPLLQGVARIVTLGDSITQAGADPGGYVWLMDRYLKAIYPSTPIEIVNAGISGHKSTDMQARFERDVLAAKPQLVTISVGVNDVWHAFRDFQTQQDHPDGDLPNGVPLPLYTEKVEAMITAATAAGIKVVLVTPTLIHENPSTAENQRLRSYLTALNELARKHGCALVDLNGVMTEVIVAYRRAAGPHRNVLTTDGVHMNAAGNQLMAWQILRGMGVPEMALAKAQIEGAVTR